ncbi:hypothetical protein N8I77_004299 [Diaporthe amygdali]|uniref:Fusicoccin H C-9 hydroxylase n=2 Tax=Phomopsis amygdali TaxID=1214568 RepID=FC10_PHOAM|nr:RecName: Full=Fusicoccin H C-9 hydroxylase; AltName: Full=Cytochrome P450 monooxygenase PaP450-4; AltName: Full=Fusicoccin A biosynthetic gene clusters protein 10 [Diaporthe amygdali]KAK2610910.1 hypothetical protein N8I77_004299 [Diaporthe amygdali]BAM71035.1 fusicoccin H C-9 hydroxylase [Diaporthe amygdali]
MAKFTVTSLERHLLLISTVIAVLAALIVSRGCNYLLKRWKLSAYPLYEDKKVTPIEELHSSRDLIAKGFAKSQGKEIWRINTTIGEVLVVSPKYIEKFRYGHGCSAAAYTERELPISAPGYEPFTFASNEWRQRNADIILHRLTGLVSNRKIELSEELSNALESRWTNSTDWHAVSLFQTMTAIVAQTTQYFFTNRELCRNDAYIQSLFAYSSLAFTEGRSLMKWPRVLHPLVARFHPASQNLQSALENVNKHIFPFVRERRAEISRRRFEAAQSGKETPLADEWVAWLDEKAGNEDYNPGVAMVSFSVASFHTTTDFMCQLLCDLARNPAIIEQLKEEASDVLRDHTWTKSSFARLDLMDRCMKESQRLKPIGAVFLKSRAQKDISVENGNIIPAGSLFVVSGHWMHDPAIYPEPEKFDPGRHLRHAEESKPNKPKQFTAVSPEHMGWGYGKHSCPGRFFAATVAKMLLTHILFKYEFKLPDGKLNQHAYEFTTEILVRRRIEEGALNLDSFDSIDR